MDRRKRIIGAVLGAMLALGGIVATASPAEASPACPLYNGFYSSTTGARTDSYGTWSEPSYALDGSGSNGFRIKAGGTTCGGNVYVSNVIGGSTHPIYARVWYMQSDGVGVSSHSPVTVPMHIINQGDSTLYNLGPVPTGYLYQVQLLAMAAPGTPVTGAGCRNLVNAVCGARSRG